MNKMNSSLVSLALSGFFVSFAAISSGCSSPTTDAGSGSGGSSTTSTTGNGPDPVEYPYCYKASTCPPVVAPADLTTPAMFKADVYPILLQSCSGGAACHGMGSITQIHFGTALAPLDEAGQQALVTQLTTADSEFSAGTKLVAAGDWTKSFLMMKLDGCQNDMGLNCTPPATLTNYMVCTADDMITPFPCGDGMPQSNGTINNPDTFPLEAAHVNKIRAWIQQGALFN